MSERPTSGATPAELASQLHQTRTRTLRLTEELSSEQLMGLKLDIVNPALWEIGHVGWFHEYWTLRHSHRQAPLIDRGDALWNSSTVPHDTRWSLDLPDREATFGYLAKVLDHQCDWLTRGDFSEPAHYFYELVIRHEDMHVEALTYMRETLAYPSPRNLGDHASTAAGDWPGDVEVAGESPGGSARPPPTDLSLTTRNGGTRSS
jgi:iron(II)-dependent oxidoreductase